MSDEPRQNCYLRLLSEERAAFERASKVPDADRARRTILSREWFEALHKLLNEYCHSLMQPEETGPLKPFPSDAILACSNIAQMLASGNIPQPIKDINLIGGSPDRWPGECRDIATALDYIEHARAGTIRDRAFIVSVSTVFQVDRTTVRDWQNASEQIRTGFEKIPAHQFPNALLKAGARYHFNRKGERTEGVE
ncbi:hypothetical protein M8756_02325 [Lutimaribacter sp. EGI FJ00015]|uniref:Uncharacterized protein n=1 Tax=Lutimaribacter degradans TaxID=2945989 RepID=A0ACC5ZRY2_9RHOB|nr:hypothetical protein [Lutimaribacter sp. EGI FJ00013]MCM2560923.1 hypothetical protein [Lutimaribacter sp. EGI FJ00013]MCO0612131.1 hypothetical protein [Lutimaribacter sp. EGI FJ00015]MCO0634749.1 hypothetical protein [Lutimaribacter sp. EGI FJ00014]